MGVVPLVCSAVAVGILLHYELLRAHYFSEQLDLHAFRRQLRNIESALFVVIIGEAMRTIIK